MILSYACFWWAFASASVALWAWLRSRPRAPRAPRGDAPLILLRPCAGREAALDRALLSSSELGPSNAVRFLLAADSDLAMPQAKAAALELTRQGFDARVLVTGALGPNRKADQLARALAALPDTASIVVVADSDVLLKRDMLAELVRPILTGEADATWAPPLEIDPLTPADRASQAILDASLQSFAVLAALDPSAMVGKLFAITREALARIGGLGALVNYLGEDMELARRLRFAGLRVRAGAVPAASLARGRTARAVVERYARWITVIRGQRPWLLLTYPLLLVAAPLQLILALAAVAVDGRLGVVALAAVIAARSAVALLARRLSRQPLAGAATLAWVADAMLLAAFARAIASRSFEWRGVALRIGRGGVLTRVER